MTSVLYEYKKEGFLPKGYTFQAHLVAPTQRCQGRY